MNKTRKCFSLYDLPGVIFQRGYDDKTIDEITREIKNRSKKDYRYSITNLEEVLGEFGIMGEMRESIVSEVTVRL
jgi:hypothetical protein